MENFSTIKKVSNLSSNQCSRVVDEFLLYYAASRENLDREMDRKLAPFRHITRQLSDEWLNRIKAQYIAHRIFRKGGFIDKYLRHSALRQLDTAGRSWLEHQASHPWRFLFSSMEGHPAPDFFEMEEVFTGETYLLYSPGTARELEINRPVLWFNLVAYNGECWQTYGPISAYLSFEPEDILFYFRELRPHLAEHDDVSLMEDVERNPIPYMMLFAKSQIPLVFHRNHQLVFNQSEFTDDDFDSGMFEDGFKSEYADGISRFTLHEMGEYPHYAIAYYEEREELLTLTAMTDEGFGTLVRTLNRNGYDLPVLPERRVNLSMHATARELLQKEIKITPYEHLFHEEPSEENQKMLDKINHLMQLYIPVYNEGGTPDLELMARETELDLETVEDLLGQIMANMDKANRGMG